MAVNLTTVRSNANSRVVDIEATADGDTTATIAHGLAAAPTDVTVTMLVAAARISAWAVTTIDATNVVLTKTTTAGSGAAGVQARCIIARPHSLSK